jgi:hypothetical protein
VLEKAFTGIMKIKTKDTLYNVLNNAGYSFHFTDCDGWIKDLGKGKKHDD